VLRKSMQCRSFRYAKRREVQRRGTGKEGWKNEEQDFCQQSAREFRKTRKKRVAGR